MRQKGHPHSRNTDLARNRFHDHDDFSPTTCMGDKGVTRQTGEQVIAFVAKSSPGAREDRDPGVANGMVRIVGCRMPIAIVGVETKRALDAATSP